MRNKISLAVQKCQFEKMYFYGTTKNANFAEKSEKIVLFDFLLRREESRKNNEKVKFGVKGGFVQ